MNQSLTVYGASGSGSVPVEAALTLIGRPYKVIEGATWEHDPKVLAQVQAVNPMPQSPAVVLPSGEILTESAAILTWLADAHPEARLRPPVGAIGSRASGTGRRRPPFQRMPGGGGGGRLAANPGKDSAMRIARPLLLVALLAMVPAAAAAAPASAKPFRLRCEIAIGDAAPTVQFFRIDPPAGEVRGEPGALYTRAGVPEENESITGVRVIDAWTDDEIVLRWEVRWKDGPQTSTHRDVLDLRTLKVRLEVATQMSTFTLAPATYYGRCKRVAMDAPPK